MFFFALVVIVLYNFAFNLGFEIIARLSPGILWTTFLFSGTLGLARVFDREKANGCILGLLLGPVDPGAIFLAKLTGIFLYLLFVELFTIFLLAALFNVPVFDFIGPLLLTLVLGNLGFLSIGVLFSAMLLNTRAKDLMMPLLMYPIIVPVLIAAVKMTTEILAGRGFSTYTSWINILIAFDIIYLTLCFMLFDFAIRPTGGFADEPSEIDS
jgi:heme exporter protein B